jgi:predicted  nucleic acid-binding Zn-ribbon protein
MGKGGYAGGSTIIRPGSNWFSYGAGKTGKAGGRHAAARSQHASRTDQKRGAGLTRDERLARLDRKIASIESEIEQARDRLLTLAGQLADARKEREEAARPRSDSVERGRRLKRPQQTDI